MIDRVKGLTQQSTRTLRDKAAQRRLLLRWAHARTPGSNFI
jgi:hypothetical protein